MSKKVKQVKIASCYSKSLLMYQCNANEFSESHVKRRDNQIIVLDEFSLYKK